MPNGVLDENAGDSMYSAPVREGAVWSWKPCGFGDDGTEENSA